MKSLLILFLSITHLFALEPKKIPKHPYLSPVPSIHLDHQNTSVTDAILPVGKNTKKREINFSRFPRRLGRLGFNTCLNFMQDHNGNLLALCGSPRYAYLGGLDFHLALMDPKTFKKKSKYSFERIKLLNIIKNKLPINLGYYVMDNLGRVIVVNSKNEVLFLKAENGKIVLDKKIDLKPSFPNAKVAQVMPDFQGNYWVVTLGEIDKAPMQVAYFDKNFNELDNIKFQGEIGENGIAMDENSIYAVTDFSMYRLKFNGKIETTHKIDYERSTFVKRGVISPYGSGTTPTVMENGMVVITDNADHRVNLLVYDFSQEQAKEVCKVPLFSYNDSANENSVLSYKNSIIIQNWFNAPKFLGKLKQMSPGLVRYDYDEVSGQCKKVWENNDIASTATVKMSTATGLIYAPIPRDSILEKYDLAMIDFETGKIKKKVYLGRGFSKRQVMAPINIGKDGTLIQPVFSGVVTFKDQ